VGSTPPDAPPAAGQSGRQNVRAAPLHPVSPDACRWRREVVSATGGFAADRVDLYVGAGPGAANPAYPGDPDDYRTLQTLLVDAVGRVGSLKPTSTGRVTAPAFRCPTLMH
jgi:hypothetical protein